MLKDVLRETIAKLKGIMLINMDKATPTEKEVLLERFHLLQKEENALRDPSTPQIIKQSIYDKIDRLYCHEYRQWIESNRTHLYEKGGSPS